MKKVFSSLLLASTLLLSGCSADKPLDIEFNYFTPTAYIDEEYDFTEVLTVEEGVQYKLEVYVCDYITMTEKTLEVRNNFYFTPLEMFDLSVVVTATKGGQQVTKTKPVPVSIKGDPIDELLVTGGYSGFADNGISKELVTDEVYLKGENSKTAIYTSFQGVNPYTWGAAIMSLNNFRLLDYWSDKTWDNAVVHFWVFNPNDADLEFQLRIADEYTKLVNTDWGNSLNPKPPRIAKAKEWTEINFSLRRYGVDHTLFENEDGTRRDSLNVKIKYAAAPTSGVESYSYQLYIDDVDIIPFSEERFPGLDTKCYAKAETLADGWENMCLDQGWTSCNVLYDRDVINSTPEHESKSSMLLTFNETTPNYHNGYAVILCPEEEFKNEEDRPSLRHGLLELDVHFSDNITNTEIMLIAVQNEGGEWAYNVKYNCTPEATSNEWMHLSVDFATISDFKPIESCIRLGFGFNGVNNDNKETAVVHIDNIKFDQNGGTPEPETLADGWENMILDVGWTKAHTSIVHSPVNNTEQHPSTSSMKLTFGGAISPDYHNGYSVILSPQEQFSADELPHLNNGVLEFDVHFSSDVTNHKIKIIGVDTDWNGYRLDIDPVSTDGEWLHYFIDFTSVSTFSPVDACIRLGFGFNGIDNSNKENAVIHLDNVFFAEKD